MAAHTTRNPTDRDLRGLSTPDLLALIADDVRDLDRDWRARHKPGPYTPPPEPPTAGAAKGKGKRGSAVGQMEASLEAPGLFEPDPDHDMFHHVACCNVSMGDFPAIARVRCPFCGNWHRAGDFPVIQS